MQYLPSFQPLCVICRIEQSHVWRLKLLSRNIMTYLGKVYFDLPTPEVRSSNPAISKFKIYFQLYRKDKNTEKEAENVIFLKWAISYQSFAIFILKFFCTCYPLAQKQYLQKMIKIGLGSTKALFLAHSRSFMVRN